MLSSRSILPVFLKVAIAITLSTVTLWATVPRGWYIAGSKPNDYESGIDETQYKGHRVAYLKAISETPAGYGTLMQDFRANRYLGTRVRLRADLKTDQVDGWADIWLRVDKAVGDTSRILALDNMESRALKGTTDWQECQIVLDVAPDATNINFGVTLGGSGNVSISNISFESVSQDVPVTTEPINNAPRQRWLQIRRPLEIPFNLEFQP